MRKLTKHIRKGMADIEGMIEYYFFYGMLILVALFNCLANIAVLFSTRVFPSKNPTFILGGL